MNSLSFTSLVSFVTSGLAAAGAVYLLNQEQYLFPALLLMVVTAVFGNLGLICFTVNQELTDIKTQVDEIKQKNPKLRR